MRYWSKTIIFLALLLLPLSNFVICDVNTDDTKVHKVTISGKHFQVQDGASNQKKAKEIDFSHRVSEGEQVEILISNFNFIRYSLKVSEEEEVVESYVSLMKLIDSIGDLPLLEIDTTEEVVNEKQRFLNKFKSTINIWSTRLKEVKGWIDKIGDEFKDPYLESTKLEKDDNYKILTDENLISELVTLKTKAEQTLFSYPEPSEILAAHQLFDRYSAIHDELISNLILMQKKLKLCVNGKSIRIKARKAGTLVTVTLKCKDDSALEQIKGLIETRTFDYFVHSKFPLYYHVGLVTEYQDSFEFEKVDRLYNASISGEFYKKIKDDEWDGQLAAFISYEFKDYTDSESGWLLTLGTELNDVGKSWFLGPSFRFNRKFFITAGISYSEISEGEEYNQELDFYEQFKKKWDPGAFIAISFSVF